jgi:hypothetical protein
MSDYPAVIPMIAYQHPSESHALATAFGFEERAHILSEVEDGENGKRYRVEDLEGHRWMFMERR